jgi:hypothetical protein
LLSNFSKVLYYADYNLNTEKYLQNCINKQRPKMNCKGHCQLSKKLKQQQKDEQSNNSKKSNPKDDVVSSKSFFAANINNIISICFKYKVTNDQIAGTFSKEVFQPPQLV